MEHKFLAIIEAEYVILHNKVSLRDGDQMKHLHHNNISN